MKVLLVTEKCSQNVNERDGGARLVETLRRAFGDSLSIMQFGSKADPSATWHYEYPLHPDNRFERRVANATFIAERVKEVEHNFSHLIFIHISMQFGYVPLRTDVQVWTFPMFLTPSYRASGEMVPEIYFKMERLTLGNAKNILTPSHMEKRQLAEIYSVPEERIHVVPRGINRQFLNPIVRSLSGSPTFCSVGSIKPQKNTVGLLRLFAKAQSRFPGAKLRIIGPVQNPEYFADVCTEIQQLGLSKSIELTGYIPPHLLQEAIQDAHLHLSASTCETFGRAIFETLAAGLPNIARKSENAAAEFLAHLPYARFVDDDHEALDAIAETLANLSKLSSLALEIGSLYDDELLSRLLIAKICNKELIAMSDFDGTLYHKTDPEKTLRCIEAFRKFPKRIVCSARPVHDLLEKLSAHNLEVDWIVGCSGSIVTDGEGKPLWLNPLTFNDRVSLQKLLPDAECIEIEGEVLQIAVPNQHLVPNFFGLRVETYQGTAFIADWQASKLRAIHRLLNHINWSGQVEAFGDGIYDVELLNYFDGTLIGDHNEISF